jgi:hypothetical protein
MLAVPALLLGLGMAMVPAWRPWSAAPASTPTASTPPSPETPEGVVRGRVVDADGEPAIEARVALLAPPPAYYVLRETRTDAAGRFSFPDSKSVRVRVLAEHDDRGVVLSAELVIDPATPQELVLTLQPARVVRGRVTGEDGKPVAGATVVTDGPPWLPRKVTTGDDGTYRLPRVPTLARSVRATAQGFQAAQSPLAQTVSTPEEIVDLRLGVEHDIEGTVLDTDGQPVRAAVHACEGKDATQRTMSLSDGKFRLPKELAQCPLVAYHQSYGASEPVTPTGDTVVLRLRAGGAISGVVVEESGGPVATFFVGVESFVPVLGGEYSVRPSSKTFNDPGGAFMLEKLAPGTYVLSYGAEGRSAARSSPIEVASGRTTSGIRLVLSRGGTVEGQVFDEVSRQPLAGAQVAFDASTSTRGESVAPATTDAQGKFRLENAPRGPFSLRVDLKGYNTRILSGLRVDPKATLDREIGLTAAGDGGAKTEFGGVGAVLTQTRDGIAFGGVFEGGAAERAGVQQGDLIKKIDGDSVDGLGITDCIQRLRGEPGSTVRVALVRNGQAFDVAIVRAAVTR